MKKNYKLIIKYDGTRYYGWQRQPDHDTIQGKIEDVLRRMCEDESLEVTGAGRTDAGVHAKAMVANVHMDTEYSEEDILDYLNHYLPDDIAVIEVRIASDRFHARYNAIGKTYCYTCFDGRVKPVFDKRFVYRIEEHPDIELMREAATILTGEHDYRNYCVNPRMKKSTVRKVDMIDIQRDGDYIRFTFHGTGFLQNMVRILVGTLLEVGMGRLDLEHITHTLNAEERIKAGPTAPAMGLCMMKVDYD